MIAIAIAGWLTAALLSGNASEQMGPAALGAVLVLGWAFVLSLCYQGMSALLLLSARRWMSSDESSSSDYVDSKILAKTKLVMDVLFATGSLVAVVVVALKLLGIPK